MKKISALLLTFILTLFFTLSFFPATAFAADATISESGSYDVSSFDDGATVTINGGLSVTLTNTTAISGKNLKISCAGANTHLTIDGVNINSSGCALAFTGAGNTLTLIGSSTLTSGNIESGIRVEGSAELTISGTGSVEATGDDGGAGIGGGHMNDGGNITISGGTVTAHGGNKAAGIGGGYYSDAEEITITGGTVTAHSGRGAAGIGGGQSGDAEEITITGGTVNAYSYSYGDGGAGIGGGCGNLVKGSGGKITIEGGTVSAYAIDKFSGTPGAGIGCGAYGPGAEIIITGGTINATNEIHGAAIGGGKRCSDVSITITGGTIIANGHSSGIGSGSYSQNCSVTINGDAKVTATGWVGIGVGESSPGCTVTIGGSAQVTATGENTGAGIGSFGDGAEVTINGGAVFASGGTMDIGHGYYGTNEGTLTISGDSAVFFENDTFPTPTTSHTYFSTLSADSNSEIYGVKLPSGWTEASGYYSDTVALLLEYDPNGALGTKPDGTLKLLAESLTFTAEYADDLSYTGAKFVKWNTEPDGSGTDIFPAFTYTAYTDITLYAIWNKTMISLTLDKSSLSLSQDETYKLTASYTPSDASSTIFWISSDNSVASVDQSGNVKAIGEGSATITASTGDREDTCTVTVSKKEIATLSLNYGKKYMNVGEVFVLNAIITPSDLSDAKVTWDSSDDTVAAVNSSGVVTAKGVGVCEITATAGGKSDKCTVSVGERTVETVSLNYNKKSMYVGDVFALNAEVLPEDAVDSKVTWDSSDYTVAAVNSSGVVTAKGIGSCTITAKAGGVTDSCKVTVTREEVSVDSVSLSMVTDTMMVMYVGDTLVLSATVSPSNADDASLSWQSSNSSVASVTSLGKVTAVAEGEATISVIAGEKTDSYRVSVKPREESAGSEPTPTPESGQETQATPTPLATQVDVIYTMDIDVSMLPYGAQYIELPNGEVIELNGDETITCEVCSKDLKNGAIKVVALDSEKSALGAVDVSAEKGGLSIFVLILIAIGIFATGIGATLVVVRTIVTKKQ